MSLVVKPLSGLVLLLCSQLSWYHVGPSGASNKNLTIDLIRANFYYEESGRFGQKAIDDGTVLRNVYIGEGDAEAPTNITLVLVDLKGPINAAAQGSLEVIATAGGEELLKRTLLLKTFYSRTDHTSIPFIVYGTGCEPLEILARLTGTAGGGSSMRKILPFRCAE